MTTSNLLILLILSMTTPHILSPPNLRFKPFIILYMLFPFLMYYLQHTFTRTNSPSLAYESQLPSIVNFPRFQSSFPSLPRLQVHTFNFTTFYFILLTFSSHLVQFCISHCVFKHIAFSKFALGGEPLSCLIHLQGYLIVISLTSFIRLMSLRYPWVWILWNWISLLLSPFSVDTKNGCFTSLSTLKGINRNGSNFTKSTLKGTLETSTQWRKCERSNYKVSLEMIKTREGSPLSVNLENAKCLKTQCDKQKDLEMQVNCNKNLRNWKCAPRD